MIQIWLLKPVVIPHVSCRLKSVRKASLFYLLDYVTRQSEKSRFQKKIKIKKDFLPDITAKLFVFGVIRNLWGKNYYFETLLSFVKLCKN